MPVKQVDGKIRLGMYKAESNTFVSIPRCIVHQKGLEQTRQMLESIFNTYSMQSYDFQTESGLRTVVIKEFEEKIQVILVTGQDTLDAEMLKEISQLEQVVSIWQSIKTDNSVDIYGKEMRLLYGQKTMELHLDDLVLQLLPRSFFQLNTRQAYRLYHYVKDLIQPCDVLVEAYSGIGAMSLMLAKKAKKVIGIEYIEDAVKNANENAQRNHLKHVSFVCEDAGKALRDMKETIDALVVDPPRTGLDALMKEVILKKQPNQIVYVSCNPSTLAKDLKQLQEIYQIKSVQPFDMFSQTQHVETVALLSKLDVDKHIDVEIKLDELDLTSAESKATYAQIKEYILEKFDLNVSTLYIAQIKKKCGIELREHYNKSKKEKQVIPQCTPEKEEREVKK